FFSSSRGHTSFPRDWSSDVCPSDRLGEMGIAPRHSPLITRLASGEIRVQTESGEEQSFFVSGGVLEVQPKVVTVLADTALRARRSEERRVGRECRWRLISRRWR